MAFHGQDHQVNPESSPTETFVDEVLELLERLVGHPPLGPVIEEVVGLAVDHQHADVLALHHPVEITGPALGETEIIGERRRELGLCFRDLLG